MESHEVDIAEFRNRNPAEQEQLLQQMMTAANPDAIQRAAAAASAASPEAQKAFNAAFPGVGARDRQKLYLTVLWMLAVLAFAGLAGGAAALQAGKESAAFFMFAGLALGGLTGILAPAPSGSAGG